MKCLRSPPERLRTLLFLIGKARVMEGRVTDSPFGMQKRKKQLQDRQAVQVPPRGWTPNAMSGSAPLEGDASAGASYYLLSLECGRSISPELDRSDRLGVTRR